MVGLGGGLEALDLLGGGPDANGVVGGLRLHYRSDILADLVGDDELHLGLEGSLRSIVYRTARV